MEVRQPNFSFSAICDAAWVFDQSVKMQNSDRTSPQNGSYADDGTGQPRNASIKYFLH
jgi:hypothetical protein